MGGRNVVVLRKINGKMGGLYDFVVLCKIIGLIAIGGSKASVASVPWAAEVAAARACAPQPASYPDAKQPGCAKQASLQRASLRVASSQRNMRV
jgi:hypothetical protein